MLSRLVSRVSPPSQDPSLRTDRRHDTTDLTSGIGICTVHADPSGISLSRVGGMKSSVVRSALGFTVLYCPVLYTARGNRATNDEMNDNDREESQWQIEVRTGSHDGRRVVWRRVAFATVGEDEGGRSGSLRLLRVVTCRDVSCRWVIGLAYVVYSIHVIETVRYKI